MAEDERLARLTAICLAFPEATRELVGRQQEHATFRVRDKTFASYLDNHHGDGKLAVTFKVGPGENTGLADSDPERFYIPAYVGPKGWVGLRLDKGTIDWGEVAAFATD